MITRSLEDARGLLSQPGTRAGVLAYVSAMIGALMLLLEWTGTAVGLSEGYHGPVLTLALGLILIPAYLSAATALAAQVVPPEGERRATMQETSTRSRSIWLALAVGWLMLTALLFGVLGTLDVSPKRRFSITGLALFSPAVLAYGRVLGSSWRGIMGSTGVVASGRPSPFDAEQPTARKQFLSMIVYINTFLMPVIGLNTLISMVVLLALPIFGFDPSAVFDHHWVTRNGADAQYRAQDSIMEEGGILGYAAIEGFSFIEDPTLRGLLVGTVLSFILLNVALVGLLFVYEVARILFLGVHETFGTGGIRLTDPRLLRAEPSQQAKLLNFCFSGFAGQSMLLLALGMMTFWDAAPIPDPERCGGGWSNVCSLVEGGLGNALEELTWMLAAGGQVAFFVFWLLSVTSGGPSLSEYRFDASVEDERRRLKRIEDRIFVGERPLPIVIAEWDWEAAEQRMLKSGEEGISGIEQIREQTTRMLMHASLGQWDDGEEEALDLMAMRGGDDVQIARTVLAASSLAQRDIKEAEPRLAVLPHRDMDTLRMRWFLSVLRHDVVAIDQNELTMLSVDPLHRRNVDLIERWRDLSPMCTAYKIRDEPWGRRHLLGDIARMRLMGKSEEALRRLDEWSLEGERRSRPEVMMARLLLMLDTGLEATGKKLAEDLYRMLPNHPTVVALIRDLTAANITRFVPGSDKYGFDWVDTTAERWEREWSEAHQTISAPVLKERLLRKHARSANAWVGAMLDDHQEHHPATLSERQWMRHASWDAQPIGNHLMLSGVVITIEGLPVDLGMPADLDLKRLAGLGLIGS